MGAWGEYDDENDMVADEWIDIEQNTMGRVLYEKAKHIMKSDYETLNAFRKDYAFNNPKKLYNEIKKWLTNFKSSDKIALADFKETNNSDSRWVHSTIVGIALKAARFMQNLPASDPLGPGIFDSGIPKSYPKDYPAWLKKEALQSLKLLMELEKADTNATGWVDPKKREKALQNELLYFKKM